MGPSTPESQNIHHACAPARPRHGKCTTHRPQRAQVTEIVLCMRPSTPQSQKVHNTHAPAHPRHKTCTTHGLQHAQVTKIALHLCPSTPDSHKMHHTQSQTQKVHHTHTPARPSRSKHIAHVPQHARVTECAPHTPPSMAQGRKCTTHTPDIEVVNAAPTNLHLTWGPAPPHPGPPTSLP